MRKRNFVAGLIVATTVLQGCTGSTNPAEAGLFDNIRNLNTGEYDRQIAAREAEAAAITRSIRAMQAGIGAMESQRSANASAIASIRAELASLRAEAAAARARIGSDPVRLGQLDWLVNQITVIEGEITPSEPPRVCRRLQLLSRMGHPEQDNGMKFRLGTRAWLMLMWGQS